MGSVLLYLVVFMLSASMLYKSKAVSGKRIDCWFILAVTLPIVLAAIRDHVGTDFESYVYIYHRNAELTFIEWFTANRSVSGNRFIVWLISWIGGRFNSHEVFFGLFAALTVLPVALRLKQDYSLNICALSYFIYLFTIFISGLNSCKQVAALGVLFYGLRYIREQKLFKYILVVAFATLIHVTSVIAIVLYFFVDTKTNLLTLKKSVLIIGCVCVMLSYPKILGIIGGRFTEYLSYEGSISNKMFFLNLIWCLIFCVFHKQYTKNDPFNDVLIIMMIIASILELTGFVSAYIKRIALYFSFPRFLLMAQFPQVVISEKNSSYVKALVYLYTIALFIFQYYILGQANIIPYSCFGVTI